MGAVLLCKEKKAQMPYYIESMGIRIYSLEELAYFLYENIYLIDKNIVGASLITWLKDEVHQQGLATRLEKGIDAGSNIQNLILGILRQIEYHSNEELELLSEKMKLLKTYHEQERLKLRADEFFRNGNYQAAIQEYERILDIRQSQQLGVEFYSHIWNNLGVSYCRILMFRKAASAFRVSYQYKKDPEVLESYVAALYLVLSEEDFEEAMTLQNFQKEYLEEIIEHINLLTEEWKRSYIDKDLKNKVFELQNEYSRNAKYS